MDPFASDQSLQKTSPHKDPATSQIKHFLGMDTRILFALKQGPRSLENHIREFLACAHYSDLPDIILIEIFCDGINQPLRSQLRREGPRSSLSCFFDFALLTVGSLFTVGVADEDRDTASLTEMVDALECAHKMAAITESAPEPAPIRELAESAPEPALIRELAESAPEPAPIRELAGSAPEPAPIQELAESAPEPAPIRELAESAPEAAPIQELAEAAPIQELAESAPEAAPIQELTESGTPGPLLVPSGSPEPLLVSSGSPEPLLAPFGSPSSPLVPSSSAPPERPKTQHVQNTP